MSVSITSTNFLVFGRAGMDIYADPPGVSVELANQYFASLGGSAANIAVGISKLGGQASLISAVSDDSVGKFVLHSLKEYGVNSSYVTVVGGECRTSLAVTETRIEDTQNVIYRNNAADFQVSVHQVESINFKQYSTLILTGTALAVQPSRSAVLKAIELANMVEVPVILDIDYRPYSWESAKEAVKVYQDVASKSDILIGNDDEFGVIAGHYSEGLNCARKYVEDENKIVVYKLGPNGSLTFDSDGQCSELGIFTANAKKPTGAGDSFLSAFVMSLAENRTLQQSVVRGSASAAIVVSGIGCAPAMPTVKELEEFLEANEIGKFDDNCLK